MNDFVLEVCEQTKSLKTVKLLEKEFGKSRAIRKLDSFKRYKMHMIKSNESKPATKVYSKNAKQKNKLSFEVSLK